MSPYFILPFHMRNATPLNRSMSITLPKESVTAANLSLGETDTDIASLKESVRPYLGYTGVAGSTICFSFGFDGPPSFLAFPPPQPNHPLKIQKIISGLIIGYKL